MTLEELKEYNIDLIMAKHTGKYCDISVDSSKLVKMLTELIRLGRLEHQERESRIKTNRMCCNCQNYTKVAHKTLGGCDLYGECRHPSDCCTNHNYIPEVYEDIKEIDFL